MLAENPVSFLDYAFKPGDKISIPRLAWPLRKSFEGSIVRMKMKGKGRTTTLNESTVLYKLNGELGDPVNVCCGVGYVSLVAP